jgi:hypothetical protein
MENPTPPAKAKVIPSRHHFTTVDSEDEVDQNGDVNIRYDTVKFHGKMGNGLKDEVETFIANNELIFGLRPKQFKTDAQKIHFMATLFRDGAARWFNPYLRMDVNTRPAWVCNYSLFVDESSTSMETPVTI